MLLQPILAIVILSKLRRIAKNGGDLKKWNAWLVAGIIAASLFIVLGTSIKEGMPIVLWLGHLLMAAIIFLIFNKKEFVNARPVIYALLPLITIDFIADIINLIDPTFYKNWDNYFEVAQLCAFVWMGTMLFKNNKQNKALEKERLKNEAKEREYKITETLKVALEVQVKERTAELTQQKEELQQTLNELKSTQTQLIHSEKMASLGELTAGIAHEIQNPLNFVNNFSEINTELIEEMKIELTAGNNKDAIAIANDIAENEQKINQHGKRADAIVKGMLQHSRTSSGIKEPTDINALADEYLRLAYHGLRAKDKSFNATMKTDYDETIGNINIIPQDIGRVILNLITNAFYVVDEKKNSGIEGYEPIVSVSTKKEKDKVEIKVKDNGNGIPQKVMEKIFQPFFTTKPTGQGTGLGLSMSYDIVTKGHGGELKAKTLEGKEAEFIIILPI